MTVPERFTDWTLDTVTVTPPPVKKYSPDQPRVPGGSPDGGQWAGGEGGGDLASFTPDEPLYHGTAHAAAIRAAGGTADQKHLFEGVYLTNDRGVAGQYAQSHARYDESAPGPAEVMEATLKPGTKLADIRGLNDTEVWQRLGYDAEQDRDLEHIRAQEQRGRGILVELRNRGYDGVVQSDTLEVAPSHRYEVILFDSKSAVLKYREDQLRDPHGRWTFEGGSPTQTETHQGETHRTPPTTRKGPDWPKLRAAAVGQHPKTAFDTPEVMGARALVAQAGGTMDAAHPPIWAHPQPGTPEREAIRARIASDLYDSTKHVQRNRQAYLFLGPPASGKSAIAEPIAAANGAHVIDADRAKERLPEYQGWNAANLHAESVDIVENRMLSHAIARGDNIMLPYVGRTPAKIAATLDALQANGYKVHLALVDLPVEKAAQRAVARFYSRGRFVDPLYILNDVDGNSRRSYEAVKNHPAVVEYTKWNNDVPRHHAALVVEHHVRG